MRIWKQDISVAILAASTADTAVRTSASNSWRSATTSYAPACRWTRTVQPYGLLHGGVSVVLAETLGSCGAAWAAPEGHRTVGLDINANHLKGVRSGWVDGIARPVHVGRTTQVWAIELTNEAGELTCVSRITMAVLAPR